MIADNQMFDNLHFLVDKEIDRTHLITGVDRPHYLLSIGASYSRTAD